MYTVLRISKKYRIGSLPKMFCLSDNELCNKYIKGILISKANVFDFKKDEQLVVINSLNLTKEELLAKFNIAHSEDIKLLKIPDYLEKCFRFISFDEYKKEHLDSMKKRTKETHLKRRIIKESNLITSYEINKMYDSLNLPNIPNISKADFLEYYLYFDKDLNHYNLLKELKSKDVSWKDFKYEYIHNIRYKDINKDDRIIILGHSSNNTTAAIFKPFKNISDLSKN